MKKLNSLAITFWGMARLEALYEHLVKYKLAYVAVLLGYWLFSTRYDLSINVSNSLSGTLYLVEKRVLPSRNDYAVFLYPSDFIYHKNSRFLKRVVGVAGDVVESNNHQFSVNGKPVGTALPVTSQGFQISENDFHGVIPAGYYYMMGDHPKSLDSRYQVVGLVPSQLVVGRGYQLF